MEHVLLAAARDAITVSDLPAHLRPRTPGLEPQPESLEAMERIQIARALAHTSGRKTRAAQLLGISRKTLLEKRKRYGLD